MDNRGRPTVGFFGHDSADSAVRRRVQAFTDDGIAVTGFMMHRRQVDVGWDNVDLGATRDADFGQRLRRVVAGAVVAARSGDRLRRLDVLYARNLDMLACTFLARRLVGGSAPIVYECLDVHRLLTGDGWRSRLLRRIERSLLRRTAGLVVSSPAFLRQHFEVHYPGLYDATVIENRLAPGAHLGPRPTVAAVEPGGRPLRLGWVGVLRCRRSFDLLCGLADRFPDTVEVRLHGLPSRTEIEVFEPEIDARPNMVYAGPYQAPEDLAAIYAGLDMVWAGDFMEAGFNSVWLLPNRLYEGGYHATPPIAPAGTETARWIEGHGCGFVIEEPLDASLASLAAGLAADRSPVDDRVEILLALDRATFVQGPGELAGVVHRAMERAVVAPPGGLRGWLDRRGRLGLGVFGRLVGATREPPWRRVARMSRTLGGGTLVRMVVLRLAGRRWPGRAALRLHPRGLLHPVWIRPGTSDLDVFGQIFSGDEYGIVSGLPEVSLVVDGGANVGYSAAYFLSRYPQATVISVEPDPENLAMLRRNLAPYGDRAVVVDGALWSSPGELELQLGFRDDRHWARRTAPPGTAAASSSSATGASLVRGFTIDELMRQAGTEHISILKLDVEGAEAELFREHQPWMEAVGTFVVELHEDAGPVSAWDLFRQALAGLPVRYSRSGELVVARVSH